MQQALARLHDSLAPGRRFLLGLVGEPGAGKSTLAAQLAAAFPGQAVVVPMDGFHLANSELARRGWADRKGAPHTFDAAGYLALLTRLRQRGLDTVYAPQYRREMEEAVAGAIAVPPETALVITEGNYLLLDDGPWAQVRGQLDAAWYVDIDPALRRARLLARHQQFGRSRDQAAAWVRSTDDPNAVLIAASRARADLLLREGAAT